MSILEGAEIARPDIARPDKAAPYRKGGHRETWQSFENIFFTRKHCRI